MWTFANLNLMLTLSVPGWEASSLELMVV
jgi:hypothetical protein